MHRITGDVLKNRNVGKFQGSLFWLAVALASVSSLGGRTASAQERGANAALEEIVVTARRREESLSDMATSISVFSSENITQNNIVAISDYFLKTPNVALVEDATHDENQISIRGISNTGDGVSGTSFSLYVDEFDMQPFTTNPHLNDVEQIEILRGPQGTYFGRNASGGAINITMKKPSSEFDAKATAGFGRFDTWDMDGMVNVPLSDKVYIRASARYHVSDGYMINTNPTGGTSGEKYFSGRVAARFVPTERTTMDLTVLHADNDLDSRLLVPTHAIPPDQLFIASPSGEAITDGLEPYPRNTQLYNENDPSYVNYDYTVVIGRFEYEWDSVAFTNVTGYGEATSLRDGSADQTSYDIIQTFSTFDRSVFSSEFRLASTGNDRRLDWTLGGIYAEFDHHQNLTTRTGADIALINLGATLPPGFNLVNDRDRFESADSWAVFGEVDWHVNDRLTLTYGGRYTYDSNKGREFDAGGTIVRIPESSKDYDKYFSRFAATYHLNDDYSLYGVASQGYKAGAAISAGQAIGIDPVEPETLWNYELGIRGTSRDGRTRFSLAAFHIDWEDLQVSTRVNTIQPDGSSVTVVAIQNAAGANVNGLEFDFVAAPTDALSFDLAVGWLDGEYDNFPDAVLPGLGTSVDLSGRGLIHAPEWTISAGAQYDFNLGDYDSFVRAEWAHVADKAEDLMAYYPPDLVSPLPGVSMEYYSVPAYDVTNLRLGLKKDRYGFNAYIENLFDKNYYTGTQNIQFASGIGVRVNHRIWGVKFTVEY